MTMMCRTSTIVQEWLDASKSEMFLSCYGITIVTVKIQSYNASKNVRWYTYSSKTM